MLPFFSIADQYGKCPISIPIQGKIALYFPGISLPPCCSLKQTFHLLLTNGVL